MKVGINPLPPLLRSKGGFKALPPKENSSSFSSVSGLR